MEKQLLYIKHRLKFLWSIIEGVNDFLFKHCYSATLTLNVTDVIADYGNEPFLYRVLRLEDAHRLYLLINNQPAGDLKYFNPHPFDESSIIKQLGKQSFLMMGTFKDGELIGYFFLRFFANKKCFVGRLIDKEYRGQGIGLIMNRIMYETAWRMKFRCQSTISRNNLAVMKAHSGNKHMTVLKELKNDYLLVEFLPEK